MSAYSLEGGKGFYTMIGVIPTKFLLKVGPDPLVLISGT